VNSINRKPINDQNSEVTYSVCVICDRQHQKETRDQLESLLEAANYPVSDFDVHPFVQNEVQIFATLLSTSIDSEELNRVVDQLMTLSSVSQAFWSPSMID
jgi:putative Mg2+ transporter-C (MgtC) family protein